MNQQPDGMSGISHYLPCKGCGETMTGIVSYKVKSITPKYLCYDCNGILENLSRRIKIEKHDLCHDELTEIKKLIKASAGA